MKKLYMILAALAAMTFGAQAQDLHYGVVEVGDFEAPTEFYNGSYFDMAPTNFYSCSKRSKCLKCSTSCMRIMSWFWI